MSLPKIVDSYPPEMLDAITRAHRDGEVVIPTPTPYQMRLQFNGLRGALRKAGRGEFADQVSFHISPAGTPAEESWFAIRLRSASPIVGDIAAALKGSSTSPSAIDEAEESLNRILGKK